MAWLKNQQSKLATQEAHRKAEEAEIKRQAANRQKCCAARAKSFAERCFKDLEGKKTKFGPFNYKIERQAIIFYGGDRLLGDISFSETEETHYDGDGYPSGTGKYYDTGYYHFTEKWYDALGKTKEPSHGNFHEGHEGYSEQELAQYLLNFMKP